jgi:hypothetical protein
MGRAKKKNKKFSGLTHIMTISLQQMSIAANGAISSPI